MVFTSKNLQKCDEPHFHDEQDHKKTNIPLFSRLRGVYGAEVRKKGDVCFFLNKYKIENSDFITILGSAVTKGMMSITKFC